MLPERALLQQIVDAADAVAVVLGESGDLETLRASVSLSGALQHYLAVLGEAASHLPARFQAAHPRVKWRKVAGLREWIMHLYFGVNLEQLWQTAQEEIPVVRRQVSAILASLPDETLTSSRSPHSDEE